MVNLSRKRNNSRAFISSLLLVFIKRNDAFLIQSEVDARHKVRQSTTIFNSDGLDGHVFSPGFRSTDCLISRRQALEITSATLGTMLISAPNLSNAATVGDDECVTRGNGFAYRFVPPPEMEPGAKPVKTHLFEMNWKSPSTPKYTFGITIDPVRISSLKEVRTSWKLGSLIQD